MFSQRQYIASKPTVLPDEMLNQVAGGAGSGSGPGGWTEYYNTAEDTYIWRPTRAPAPGSSELIPTGNTSATNPHQGVGE